MAYSYMQESVIYEDAAQKLRMWTTRKARATEDESDEILRHLGMGPCKYHIILVKGMVGYIKNPGVVYGDEL